MPDQFREILAEQLAVIDIMLAEQAIALSMRPFHATCMFITECIVEIEGRSKENFLDQDWFGDIFRWVREWYEDRYGRVPLESKERHAPALIMIYGTPFKLNIPLTITQPGPFPDTIRLIFPTTIHPNENVHAWIAGPPNLDLLGSDQNLELMGELSSIASATRSMCVNLMMAELSPVAQKLSESIPTHFANCVDGIISLERTRLCISIWELFMAVEKAFKVFLHQRVGEAPYTHDINDLFKRAIAHGLLPIDLSVIHSLPGASEAIRQRYGETKPPTVDRAVEMYRNALTVSEVCARSLSRLELLGDGYFLIRKLPRAFSEKAPVDCVENDSR